MTEDTREKVKSVIYYVLMLIAVMAISYFIAVPFRSCSQHVEDIVYKKDERTGFCYAFSHGGVAEVPCSPRVLGLLEE